MKHLGSQLLYHKMRYRFGLLLISCIFLHSCGPETSVLTIKRLGYLGVDIKLTPIYSDTLQSVYKDIVTSQPNLSPSESLYIHFISQNIEQILNKQLPIDIVSIQLSDQEKTFFSSLDQDPFPTQKEKDAFFTALYRKYKIDAVLRTDCQFVYLGVSEPSLPKFNNHNMNAYRVGLQINATVYDRAGNDLLRKERIGYSNRYLPLQVSPPSFELKGASIRLYREAFSNVLAKYFRLIKDVPHVQQK